MTGAAIRREKVSMFGTVYIFSWGVSSVKTLRSGFLGAGEIGLELETVSQLGASQKGGRGLMRHVMGPMEEYCRKRWWSNTFALCLAVLMSSTELPCSVQPSVFVYHISDCQRSLDQGMNCIHVL
jgi:hypothetical protein